MYNFTEENKEEIYYQVWITYSSSRNNFTRLTTSWGIQFFFSAHKVSSHIPPASNSEFEIKQVKKSDQCVINQLAAEPTEVYDKEIYLLCRNIYIYIYI